MLPLVEPDESLTQRVREMTEPLDVRLETTGPTRLLRSVARARVTVHVTVRHRRGSIEIDLAEGLVVGARGEVLPDTAGGATQKVEGAMALAVWLALGMGRVRIERRDAPAVANVMSPVDDAIAAADHETPVLVPSIPPPAGPPSIRPPTPAMGVSRPPPSGQTDARALVTQLESLLDRLRHTLPPGSLEVPSETVAALAAAAKGPTPPRKDPTPAAVPPPAKVPAAAPKPGLRRATQVGMPVPVLSKPIPPIAPPPPKRAVPPPAPEAAPDDAEPPTNKRAALPEQDEPATAKRPVLEDDPHPPIAPPRVEAPVAVALAPEPPAPPPVVAPSQRELATEPVIHAPPAAPLEVTDQVVLPPDRPEPDEAVAIPGARSSGTTWVLIGGAVVVAVALVGLAGAWRMGVFAPAPVTSVPLTSVPPTSAPPTSAPGTSVAAPTTIAAPPTTTPPTSEVAPPVTVAELAPPTSVVQEAPPPPTTVVEEAPPPSVAELAPPPPTTTDETSDDTTEDPGDAPPPGRGDEAQRLVDRANFRRSHGDLPGAEADYLHVLRLSPNNARAMAGLARLHLARHDARTASTWARRLAEGHLPNAGNYVLLGDALQASGDTAGARRAWERALEISPGSRDARRRLGR